jgi:hypothetical protein
MKRIILIIVLAALSIVEAQPATKSNRYTTNEDNALIDGSNLINLPAQPVDNQIDIRSFGAVGDGITDDTTAIQNAINYVVAHEGGTLYVPVGTNKISTLTIPTVPGGITHSITLRIRGPLLPGQAMGLVNSAGQINGGAIWKSTTVGSAGQAVLAAGPSALFNAVTLDIENLTIQVVSDPVMLGINARMAYSLRLRGVRVWTGLAPFDITTGPTHNQSAAIATPANNNAAFTYIRNVDVCGFWCAYEMSEHADLDYSSAWKCEQVFNFPGANHGVRIGRIGDYHCQYGIGFTGFVTRFKIDQWAIERASGGWAARIADIADTSNLGVADITWAAVLQDVGPIHSFTKLGGVNINAREIGTVTSSGTTSATTLYSGGGAPSVTPTNSVAIYVNTNGPTIYYWYNSAWH